MRKIITAAAAAVFVCAAFVSGAQASVPRIPEYENYIFIANDGFFRIDKSAGEARRMLDVTPRNMYIIDDKMYLVAEREITDGKWINTLCRFNMDGTGAEVLSKDNSVDEFKIQNGIYYYTVYDSESQSGYIASSVNPDEIISVNGRVMDIDWHSGTVFSYRTVFDEENPRREVILTDLDSGEETTVTEDFDYPEYIYNNFVNGYLYSKTYYGSTAYLYRRSADKPEREQVIKDFLDYWLSDDGKTVYYKTQDGSSVSVLKYDTETKTESVILSGADYVYMGDDHLYSFKGSESSMYSLDGELIGSAQLHMAEENKIELTIGDPVILVNGVKRETDGIPVIRDGRTMLPIRAVVEGMGGEIDWDDGTRTVTAEKGGSRVEIVIGSDTASVNGAPAALDVPAYIEDGRTMLPVRFITENLGCTVDWNEETGTVTITSEI